MPRKPYIMPPEQIIKANARSNAYNKKCRLEAKAWRGIVELAKRPKENYYNGEIQNYILEMNEQIEAM